MAAATSAQMRFLMDASHLMRQTSPQTSAHLMRRRIDIASNAQAAAAASAASNGSTGPSAPSANLPQTDIQKQHVCTSCGLILIPGSDGTTLTIKSGRPSQKSKKTKNNEPIRNQNDETVGSPGETEKTRRVQEPHAGITKVYKCGLCSRETRIALPPPPPLSRPKKQKTAPAAVPEIKVANPAPSTLQKPTTSATKPQISSTKETAPGIVKSASNANSKKRAKNRKAGLLALLDKSRGSDNGGMGSLNLSFDDFRKK